MERSNNNPPNTPDVNLGNLTISTNAAVIRIGGVDENIVSIGDGGTVVFPPVEGKFANVTKIEAIGGICSDIIFYNVAHPEVQNLDFSANSANGVLVFNSEATVSDLAGEEVKDNEGDA